MARARRDDPCAEGEPERRDRLLISAEFIWAEMYRRLLEAYRTLPLRHEPGYPLAVDTLNDISEHLNFLQNTLAATPPGTLAGARALARAILAVAGGNAARGRSPLRPGYPDPEMTQHLAEFVLYLEKGGETASR